MLKKILLTSAALSVVFVFAALAQTEVASKTYELPGDAVYPEGVAVDPAGDTFYVSSTTDGTIFQGDVATGEVTTFVSGSEGRTFSTIGLAVDEQGRLWVAGGMSGQIFIYDTETAEQIGVLETPEAEATFLNDVIVTSAGDAYVTDSNRPVLFKVSAEAEAAEPWLDFTGTAFEYQEGTNANGIVITPDEQQLIVIQLNTGQLYRISLDTKEVSEIAVEGGDLSNGDGLVLDGQTLYVVRNANNEVAVVALSDDFASGTITSSITDASFAFPTTAAKVGDRLLVVNSQFNTLQGDAEPTLPFTVSSVEIP